MNHEKIIFAKEFKKIPEIIKKITRKNDMIIFMGAGNINSTIKDTIEHIKKIQS